LSLKRKRGQHDNYRGILESVKANEKIVPLRRANKVATPHKPDTAKLARLIAAYAPHDGSFKLRVPACTPAAFHA